jgi:hypothetical protein
MGNDRVADLELVLRVQQGSHEPLPGGQQFANVPDSFAKMSTALSSANIEYVLGWAMAYGLYSRARYTNNINILALPHSRTEIEKAFVEIGFELTENRKDHASFGDPACGVVVNVMFGDADPVRSAVKNPAYFQIFGVSTRVIEPEYLLWMCCESDFLKHSVHAIELVLAGHVDIDKLRCQLDIAEKGSLFKKVRKVIAEAERQRLSTYSASVIARMSRK